MHNLKTSEKSFVIRLEPVILLLEILKLQNKIDISWITILALILVPMAIGKLLTFFIRRKLKKMGMIK